MPDPIVRINDPVAQIELLNKALNDAMSTGPRLTPGRFTTQSVIYRNPNIPDGPGSFWAHHFLTMGA